MTTYAKRTCADCGIRLPQPDLFQLFVTVQGVTGNLLAPRVKWFCQPCATKRQKKQSNPLLERRLSEEKEHHAKKKKEWAKEQERRRLRNISVES